MAKDDKFSDGMQFDTLYEALKAYGGSGYIPFHMPGHKRNPKYEHLLGVQDIDVTEIDGFDDLHDARGIISRINERAARAFSVGCARILVGGSTAGILASIRALTRGAKNVVIARNCHKSVYNAVELCGLTPYYVYPEATERGMIGSLSLKDVDAALLKSGANTVVITSPTYDGVASDIEGIARVCRSRGAKLIVDEAHGAHLGLADGFLKSARTLGADVVVNSLHKTLPALTQTALLSVCGADPDSRLAREIDEQLAIFETSSPSYPLMAATEGCIRYVEENKEELTDWSKRIDGLRARLAGLRHIELWDANTRGVFAYDKTKLVLLTDRAGLSGARLLDILREEYGVQIEMASASYALAMCGAGDSDAMYDKIARALFDIDDRIERGDISGDMSEVIGYVEAFKAAQNCRISQVMTLKEAAESPRAEVPASEAEGKVSAQNIYAYPPGCPIVARGERISKEQLALIEALIKSGAHIVGGAQKISIVSSSLDKRQV